MKPAPPVKKTVWGLVTSSSGGRCRESRWARLSMGNPGRGFADEGTQLVDVAVEHAVQREVAVDQLAGPRTDRGPIGRVVERGAQPVGQPCDVAGCGEQDVFA